MDAVIDEVAPVVGDLRARVEPGRVATSRPVLERAAAIWNGAARVRPAVVVRCESTADVVATVGAAREHGLPLSVRAGGHDWAGRAVRAGGVVVDLSGMRSVVVDPVGGVATVGGGATSADLIAAAAPYGLVAATGTVGAVGVAGLTTGGGYGPVNGRFGLAADNLLGAEVVLADGRVVVTDAEHEPDLLWALRGGGGNFGVVTSLRIALHRLAEVTAGFVFFPWAQAERVLGGLYDLLPSLPDELTVQAGILPAPDGSPTAVLSPTWSGDPARAEAVLARLTDLGTPLMAQVAPMTYRAMLGLFDAHVADGRHYAITTRTLADVSTPALATLLAAGESRTSPLTGIMLHHFHGAATRVATESTAFPLRSPHFLAEVVAAWEPGDGTGHTAWAEAVSADLAPHSLPGGYANLLGPQHRDQAALAFGPNTARLRAAKAAYDPDGTFTAIPLPPA